MSALSIQPTYPIFTDIDGQPLDDGYIFIGVANLQPIGNPINVYWDAALTIPAAQPIRTISGYPANAGTPGRLYVNSDYSIQVQNKNGTLVYSAPTPTERLSSNLITFVQAGVGAVSRTAQNKMRETISVKDFGAKGDGVTDDTAAIQAALDAMPKPRGGNLFFPTGNYIVSASLIMPLAPSINQRVYINLVGESTAPLGSMTTITYTATSGALIEGRGVSGTDTNRCVLGFKDIHLYGQYVYDTSSTNTSVGINLYEPVGFLMDNVLISGFKYCLYLESFWYYSNIDFCRFQNCDYGIYVNNGAANGTSITKSAFIRCDTNAMYLFATGENLNISQCWFETVSSDVIRVLSSGRKINIKDCYFEYDGSGYALHWTRESDPDDKSYNIIFDGCYLFDGSSADAVIYANNTGPNNQSTSVTISNVTCYIPPTSGATEFLKTAGINLMSVVFINQIRYVQANSGLVLPNGFGARYEKTLEATPIGQSQPDQATFTSQYLKQSTSVYSYDTQELTNYKTDVSDGVAFDIFKFDKLGTGGTSSLDYVSCGGILEISYGARRVDDQTARVATERIPINIGSVSSGNIALATGTPVITAAVAGTNCTIALSLSATSSTSATLACSLTIAAGTLGVNDLMFRLKVTNAADSNARIMSVNAV
jgi:hypothetical protein